MNKNVKKMFSVLIVLILTFPSYVFASEKDAAYTTVSIEYSNGFFQQAGDGFQIEYKNKETKKTQILEMDVAEITKKPSVKLEKGKYSIVNIKYTGFNDQIESNGYAVTTEFTTSSTGGTMIHIAVGLAASVKMYNTYQSVIYKKDEKITEVQTVLNETKETEAAPEETALTEEKTQQTSQVSDKDKDILPAESFNTETLPTESTTTGLTNSSQVGNDYEPTVIDYQNETEKKAEPEKKSDSLFGSFLSKFLFFLFVGCLAGIGGYLIYRNNE